MAVGSQDGLRSSTWRAWGDEKKGDVYISRRGTGGIIKVSIHRDGNCQIGFTQEYENIAKERFPDFESRHWKKWKIPDEPLVRVLQIVVPNSELRAFPSKEEKQTTWIPSPPQDSVSVVTIFIKKPNAEDEVWPGAAEGIKPLGVIPSENRIAWAVYSDNPIDDNLREFIARHRLMVANRPKAASAPRGPETRMVIWGARDEHCLFLVEYAWDPP